MKINLIPMAGKGNRFLEEQYRVAKPFIPILGEPMYAAALRSFPAADKSIFICRQEHEQKLNRTLQDYCPSNDVIVVDRITEGQACTCLLAKNKFKDDDTLFIASCDYQTVYDEARYQALLDNKEIDVIIWTFKIGSVKKAAPEAFAYCRTDPTGRVLEVVEKKTISSTPHLDPAVVGSFTYKRAALFIQGAEKMIQKNIRVNNEFYVGTSINQLIEAGVHVVTFEVDKFISFGNPFELQLFHYWEDYFHPKDDPRLRYGFVR